MHSLKDAHVYALTGWLARFPSWKCGGANQNRV